MTAGCIKDEVCQAFKSYFTLTASILNPPASHRTKNIQEKLKVAYIDPADQLRSLVAKAEKSSQFEKLRSSLCGAFVSKTETSDPLYDNAISAVNSLHAEQALQAYFRRSKTYQTLFAGHSDSPPDAFDQFWTCLTERTVTTTTFRILNEVEFASPIIDLGNYKIKRFGPNELERLTNRDVNDVFYPLARLHVKPGDWYWLLLQEFSIPSGLNLEGTSLASEAEFPDFDEWQWSAIKQHAPDHVIRLLAIHDWTPDLTDDERDQIGGLSDEQIKDFWWGPSISEPFVCDNDLFCSPRSFPYTNPPVPIDNPTPSPIGRDQEEKLKALVKKGDRVLRTVEILRPHWDFIDIAMNHLANAFLSERDIEQLLWNITVLDSLLSEKTEVTQSMKRRIVAILGTTDRERRQIKAEFEELYNFRSDLVHGNRFKKKVGYRHLAKARDFARRVLVWFIDYLLWIDDDFRKREIPYEQYPRRNELLYPLDFEGPSINRLNNFIGRLPTGFPKF
jgi:hypothetical protein